MKKQAHDILQGKVNKAEAKEKNRDLLNKYAKYVRSDLCRIWSEDLRTRVTALVSCWPREFSLSRLSTVVYRSSSFTCKGFSEIYTRCMLHATKAT